MRKRIRIDSVEMFEYYDGFVSGLVTAGDLHWLACLLAYDPGTLQKTYLMPNLSPEQAKTTHTLFETKGPEALNKRFFLKLSAKTDAAFLTGHEPDKGKTLEISTAPDNWQSILATLSFPLIEKAVLPGPRNKWLK